MNDIGIVSHLMDNGYQEEFFMQCPEMAELLNKELHPIQFAELCAKFNYKSFLFFRTPKFIMIYDKDRLTNIFAIPLSGIAFDDWNQIEYARYLAFFCSLGG